MELYEMLGSGLMRLIIAGVILLTGSIVLPWLKEQRIYSKVVKFVRAAEKLAQAGTITKESKKTYVLKLLEANGVKITPEVEAFIEAAVTELDLAIESGMLLLPDFIVGEEDLAEEIEEFTEDNDFAEGEVID